MPVPSEYQRASLDFDKFMVDARDIAGLATTNMAWNMVVGVLHTFRRRLDVRDAARFANVLPPVLRAAHNFAPDTAIRDVATALRRNIDDEDFDRVLAELPEGAVEFWRV